MKAYPICGTCGEQLHSSKVSPGEYICRVCEQFFEISSIIKNCSQCTDVFGIYPRVDRAVLSFISDYHIKKNLWEELCPDCRISAYEQSPMKRKTGLIYVPTYKTTCEIIRGLMNEREATRTDFNMKGIPPEFIKFCLGD